MQYNESPTVATIELQRTHTEDRAGSEAGGDTGARQRLRTASTNRGLVPLTKGDTMDMNN